MLHLIDKSALVAEIEKCYNECLKRAKITDSEYWNAKGDAYRNVLTILNDTLEVKEVQEEPVSDRFVFKAIPRLLEKIEPTDRAKAYTAKLADTLEVEGYSTDAKIVRESLKIMNGEKVPMATMDEEPVSDDFEMALAEMIDKAQKCVVEPWVVAAQWKDELIKLAKSDLQNLSNVERTIKEWKEETVSEDLGEYINELSKQFPEVSFAKLSRIAVRVAKWQKEQMMAKAIDGKVIANGMGNPILHLWDKGRHLIDKKVKVILIKED